LNLDIKALYFKLIDLISDDDERDLDKKQEHQYKYNDDVTSFNFQIQRLTAAATALPKVTASTTATHKALSHRLSRMKVNLQSTVDAFSREPDTLNSAVIELHSKRLANTKRTLESVYDELLYVDLDDADALFSLHSKLDQLHLDCSL